MDADALVPVLLALNLIAVACAMVSYALLREHGEGLKGHRSGGSCGRPDCP